DHPAADLPHLRPVGRPQARSHGGDLAVLDQQVGDLIGAAAGVDYPAAAQQERPHQSGLPPPPLAASASSGLPPARRWSTAIRTATPLVTWSRITLCGPSAT